MPDIDTTIIFFGTLIYVIAILVGFFIINELRETNKNFKKIMTLLFHSAFFTASKESANPQAKKIKSRAYDILSKQFPEEIGQIVETESRLPNNGFKRGRYEEFEGLPLNDLM